MSPLSLFGIVLVVMIILGFPLYFAFLCSCMTFFFMTPQLSMPMLPQRMTVAMDSFPFLAIPFFTLAGQIMNRGGITQRIFDFADKMVGRFRGGLGYVNILASFIFSGMSGSALADISGLGVVEIEAMKKAGYDDDFSIGVTAASAIIGPIVPPSMPFVTYALFANVSLGTLFMAGFAPGFIMAITMCIMTFIFTLKRNYPRSKKYSIKEIWNSFKISIFSLLSPVILIFGIWFGWFTPTEAAMVCVIYSLVVGFFLYKDVHIKDILPIVNQALDSLAPITSICLASLVMAFVFNFAGMNRIVQTFVTGITENKYVFLLLVNIFLLICGCLMDASALSAVLIPILAPLAASYGISLIHFGVIFSLNTMIGLLTPPIGTALYLVGTVTGKSFKEVVGAVGPWLIPLFVSLFAVTYWEGLVLLIPRLLGLAV